MWIVFKLFFLISYWGYTSFFLSLVLQSWLYIWLDGWLLPHSNFPFLWQCLWHIQIILVSDKACCISKFKIFWYIACLILVGSNSISIIGSFNRNKKSNMNTIQIWFWKHINLLEVKIVFKSFFYISYWSYTSFFSFYFCKAGCISGWMGSFLYIPIFLFCDNVCDISKSC